jgi:lysozyme
MTAKTLGKASVAVTAAIIATAVPFTSGWEGTDYVAKRDMIGTGHPITFCHGQTDEFGKVKVGTRFTKEQCDEMLAKSLPKYLEGIQKCTPPDAPIKVMASLLDAAYNAGPAAVCRSPMVTELNAGNVASACKEFKGWYETTKNNGVRVVVPGLKYRREGDSRKGETQFCLEGVTDPKSSVLAANTHPAVRAAVAAVVASKAAPRKHWWQILWQRIFS